MPTVSSTPGAELVTDAVLVDQSPIGRTPPIQPGDVRQAFDDIRAIFGETRDAAARNLRASHFSFNSPRPLRDMPGQRDCHGGDAVSCRRELLCEDCRGGPLQGSVLEVRYKGKNIAEVLDLTVREAIDFLRVTLA